MAGHLSLETYEQFLASARQLALEKTDAITCSERTYKIKGVDLDAFHRHHRICAKNGLMKAIESLTEINYTLTPRGLALYDQYKMRRKK